jgi:hypothetical protein
MRIGGFYKPRVFAILAHSALPLTANEVWNIFRKRFQSELAQYAGRSKKATIEAVLSRFATHDIVYRTMDDSSTGCYRYYVRWKHQTNESAAQQEPEPEPCCPQEEEELLSSDEKEVLGSLLTLASV